ncbi:hypothetical protein APUTEX25_004313 [Auxenochlorella protothecoides]|uniref:Uncharacterized protein n=1 Tax=Auxenochlorella protothecoides TaxID=3075 RepID=A0A3M7L5H2_AUXPR|nr:hypothetical protein APUTEX25_004313 [Auxenochlorella protothecoides]|eukprot:RMZ57479.1 hypothetical protein APUTEX25_004313 [Auxenochlorella protothecoides]
MHVADATELGVNIRTTHAQDRRRGRAGKQPTLLDTAVNCMQCGKVYVLRLASPESEALIKAQGACSFCGGPVRLRWSDGTSLAAPAEEPQHAELRAGLLEYLRRSPVQACTAPQPGQEAEGAARQGCSGATPGASPLGPREETPGRQRVRPNPGTSQHTYVPGPDWDPDQAASGRRTGVKAREPDTRGSRARAPVPSGPRRTIPGLAP